MTTLLGLILLAAGPPVDGTTDYLRDVKPVLARRCYACHGALKRKAGLRLDTAASIRKGGDGGSAVEPGQALESLLVDRVSDPDPAHRMPPEGEPLAPNEIGHIKNWIDGGATIPDNEQPQADPRRHWAFQPPKRAVVPTPKDSAWSHNPIDAFLAAEHERRGLSPRPEADKATILRRVHLDLIGLAPTREELHSFLNDPAPDAYEKVVDRLLASPRFGERWGRHWMDVWRYSDWAGFGAEVRESQPHIWRWRDWIISSLNADKGYDRMIVEMLAGDELAPDDPDTLRATGYLVRNWYKFNRDSWLQNTVDHTAKAFLGVTLACARCHDHKYDPIAQVDYYRFRAFFEPHHVRADRIPGQPDTAKDGLARVYDAKADTPTYLYVRGEEKRPDKDHPLAPGVPKVWGGAFAVEPIALSPPTAYPGLRPHVRGESIASAEAEVVKARTALEGARKLSDAARERLAKSAGSLESTAEVEAKSAIAKAEADAVLASSTLTTALANLEAVKARIAADAGKYADPPDSKHAHILALIAGRAERRAAVFKAEEGIVRAEREPADKIAAKRAEAKKAIETARVEAAKLSANYTPLTPIYPSSSTGRRLALSRWITARDNPLSSRVAVNHIWMRHFGSPLVETVFDLGLNGRPPTNPALLDWLAVEFVERGWGLKSLHRLIVTSRAYRMGSSAPIDDPNATIDPSNIALWRMNPRRMEGEIVRDNVLHVSGGLDLAMGGPELDQNSGLTSFRRSVYYRHAPEKLMTFLKVFDAANTNACYRRDVSVVPHQALAQANSPLTLARARKLGQFLNGEVGPSPTADASFITAAFERVLSRPPTDDERTTCIAYLGEQSKRLAEPTKLTTFADGPPCAVAPASDPHARARENLVHVLLNHTDFVTIR